MFHSEYIYKDDIATFIIELYDNELYLYYSDEKSCKLLGIDYPCQENTSLAEIIPAKVYKMLLDVSCNIGLTCNVISLRKSIYFSQCSKPYSLTMHSYPLKDRKLIYVCCTDSTKPDSNFRHEISTDLRYSYYNVSFDLLFKLQITLEDRLLLVNNNSTFLSYFNRNKEHFAYSDLSNLLAPAVYSFFLENSKLAISKGIAFSRLLDYTCSPLDEERYLCPPKNHFTLLVTFFPLSKQNVTTILCCARDIMVEMEAKNQTQELLEEYNALFSDTSHALAIFNCENPYHPILERSNQRMIDLSKQVGYDKLFNSTIWHDVIKTQNTIEDMFTVQIDSKTLHYKVVIIPLLHDGVITKAIISTFDITDQVNHNIRNSIKLTKREEEIISYVVQGEKNDFIAARLCVSVGTIKRTLSNAYNKLGISSRVELLNYYHSHQFDK